MCRWLCVLASAPLFAVGCLAPGDAPPWQRPGLDGGKVAQALQKAVKDTDDEMQMHTENAVNAFGE